MSALAAIVVACDLDRATPDVVHNMASELRRALGARTAVVGVVEGDVPDVGVSGADQQALGIWCRRVLGEYGRLPPSSMREIKKRLDADAPSGVELAPVVQNGKLTALAAARGFRAREPAERRSETLLAVSRVLHLFLAAHNARASTAQRGAGPLDGVLSELTTESSPTSSGGADTLRERLMVSERWASVGQLAAGVAHAVNNPLAALLANLQALGGQLRSPAEADPLEINDVLRESVDAVQRISTTVEELRAFARIDREEIGEVDVNDVVRRAARLADNELRHRAKLELELTSVPLIRGDRTKLAQLVMNLLVNAAQSFDDRAPEQNVVRVRTGVEEGFVRISVQDNGVGIPAEEVDRIFQPFFTTKPVSVGIGLGLPIAQEIAIRHRGRIEVRSRPGEGTRADAVLPVQTGLVARPTTIPPSSLRAHHRARVLIVDDEPSVLRAFVRLLRHRHEVVTASSGAEALEILRRDREFDVVLCDVMMPELDGAAVFEQVLQLSPGLASRIVFCTGGEFTERARSFVASVDNIVLNKPVDAGVLHDTIAAVLARRSLGGAEHG